MLLNRVFAYRDVEPMGKTRWRAHKVYCTREADQSDKPGAPYVVKFCQGRDGAAAMISEVLCSGLLRAGGVATLQPVIVEASGGFAESWNLADSADPLISEGLYFGTEFRDDVMPGPPPDVKQVDNLEELFDIWVFDCWLCNIDRRTFGNVLMKPTKKGAWQMIASDQSDCFCGASNFGVTGWRDQVLARGRSEGIFVPECVAQFGAPRLNSRVQKCRAAMQSFGEAVDQVPANWWNASGIDAGQLEETLWGRLDRLPQVLRIEEYGEFDYGSFNVPII